MESLIGKIKESLPNYTNSTLHNILLLSFCVFQVGTVNLNKLKSHVGRVLDKDITSDSGYKRLIRIFDNHAHSRLWLDLMTYVFSLLRLHSDYLILDGTSWKFQGLKHHYMTLGLLYQNVSIPIYWIDLFKLGISSQKERKKLLSRALRYFNLRGKILLADREYVGEDWFKYLVDNKIDFVIRLRDKNYQKDIDTTVGRTYHQMKQKALRSKKPNKALKKSISIQGVNYIFIVAKNPKKNAKEKVLYLLTTLDEVPAKTVSRYALRWKIECCFKHMKSNGFQLEQINLRGKARPKLLTAIVLFAYVISIHEGLKEYKKVRIIKRKDQTTVKAVSVFRYGREKLITKLNTLKKFITYIQQNIRSESRKYNSLKLVNV